MNREDVDNDLAVENNEILRGRLEQAEALLQSALHEMCNTSSPRNSFTDTVDAIDAFLASQQGEHAKRAEQAEGAQGHGHVTPRADGFLARCGGPGICKVCQAEQARAALAQPSPAPELDDQAFDRNAERLTLEALGPCAGINPEATSIDDIFIDEAPAPTLPERGTQHRFSTTEQTCRHDFSGVWWNDNGAAKTGRECRHCGFFVEDVEDAAEAPERPEQPKRYTADVFYHNHFSTVQMEVVRASHFDEFVAQLEAEREVLLRQKHEADTALAWATRHYQALEQERDAAQDRVAELEKQQPVAWVTETDPEVTMGRGINWFPKNVAKLPVGTKLYAAPVAQAGQVPDSAASAKALVEIEAKKYSLNAAGMFNSGAPDHGQTIAVQELLAGFDDDEAEGHWEAIMAYSDLRASDALFHAAELLAAAPAQGGE